MPTGNAMRKNDFFIDESNFISDGCAKIRDESKTGCVNYHFLMPLVLFNNLSWILKDYID